MVSMLRGYDRTYSVIEVFVVKILFIVTRKKCALKLGILKIPGSELTLHAMPPYAQICAIALVRVSKNFRKYQFLDFFGVAFIPSIAKADVIVSDNNDQI